MVKDILRRILTAHKLAKVNYNGTMQKVFQMFYLCKFVISE